MTRTESSSIDFASLLSEEECDKILQDAEVIRRKHARLKNSTHRMMDELIRATKLGALKWKVDNSFKHLIDASDLPVWTCPYNGTVFLVYCDLHTGSEEFSVVVERNHVVLSSMGPKAEELMTCAVNSCFDIERCIQSLSEYNESFLNICHRLNKD